jgi:hypothetical protein
LGDLFLAQSPQINEKTFSMKICLLFARVPCDSGEKDSVKFAFFHLAITDSAVAGTRQNSHRRRATTTDAPKTK